MIGCQFGPWTIVYAATKIWISTPTTPPYRLLYKWAKYTIGEHAMWEDFAEHYLKVRISGETLRDTIERLSMQGRLHLVSPHDNLHNPITVPSSHIGEGFAPWPKPTPPSKGEPL